MRTYLETLREACARELEHTRGGTEAYMIPAVEDAAARIRALPIEETRVGVIEAKPVPVIIFIGNVIQELAAVRDDPKWASYPYWNHHNGYYNNWRVLIAEMDFLDPMKPFSDKEHWWPREFPEVPDWVLEAIEDIEQEEKSVNKSGKDLVRTSPSRYYSDGKEGGLRSARDLIFKHMPAQPAGTP